MSNNFTILAQNSITDYVEQAYLCAMSIRATNNDCKICLITNDTVSDKHKQMFDDIVDIPWGDHATGDWKVENRWKIYHACPYENTIVMDADMIVLQDISVWFEFLKNYKLFFTSNVYTYRNEVITNTYYRKTFETNHLPNIYTGLHYFEKSDLAHEFYAWLELITNNWETFYRQHAGGRLYQRTCSIDLSASIATKIMNIETLVTNPRVQYPSFTHMKPRIQNWSNDVLDRWQDRVGTYLSEDLQLKIGNYKQSGIFHYTEDDFVNDRIIELYEKSLGIC
jgi:hypothetical protein|tara:strand:- start:1080 stop:1922 length:843 start_codon:yes stop_codon:yes gene_type:complete